MPEFAYAGTVPRSYTETRAADGVIVGTVSYGDTREFDREWDAPEPAEGQEPEPAPSWWPAPDANWFPAGQDLPVRLSPDEPAEPAQAPPTKTPATGGPPAAGQAGTPKPATGAPAPSASGPAASSGTPATTPAGDGQKEG